MIDNTKIQKIIELYLQGKTQKEISILFNCSQKHISDVLRKMGIQCRNRKDVFNNKKYNDIDQTFFKEINSEASAYFLGFMYSDGCIQIKNNCYTMSLKLKSNDQIILEKFRDIMSPSSPIKITTNKSLGAVPYEYSYFRINQKEVCEQLISHGCVPNKSLILQFPTTVPTKLIRHFLRGYSDGDGTIYQNKFKNKKTINTIWKIVSTKQFCNEVAKILKEQLNINCSQLLSKPDKNKITTTLSVGGNQQVKKLLDWLYQDATIYLPRKYDKYQEFLQIQISSSKSISRLESSSASRLSGTTSASNKPSSAILNGIPCLL